MAVLGGRARHLPRAARRARPHELSRAQGPDVPADRRDRGRTDDVASRDRRRGAQLGLPVRVDPRLQPHARGALHRRVQQRGRGVRLVHDERSGRPRARGLAADHVRDRRGARPVRARATAPERLARLPPRARRQRRVEPGPARRVRRAAVGAAPVPRAARRPAPGDPVVRRRPRRHRGAALARARLRHLGDARRAAPPPLLQGALLDGAGPRRRTGAAARRIRQDRRMGGERATRSARRSWSAGGANGGRRSRSRSTPTNWTARSC